MLMKKSSSCLEVSWLVGDKVVWVWKQTGPGPKLSTERCPDDLRWLVPELRQELGTCETQESVLSPSVTEHVGRMWEHIKSHASWPTLRQLGLENK